MRSAGKGLSHNELEREQAHEAGADHLGGTDAASIVTRGWSCSMWRIRTRTCAWSAREDKISPPCEPEKEPGRPRSKGQRRGRLIIEC